MRRLLCLSAVALLALGATARAQEAPAGAGRCATPDSIAFRGATRVTDVTARADAGLVPGPVNYRSLDRAIKALMASGQYDDVQATCEPLADGSRATLVFTLKERPLLSAVDVAGTDRVSRGDVRDRIDLLTGRPLDPALISKAIQRIDSLYQSEGYFVAVVKPETTIVNGQVSLLFRVDEGKRLAVSGVNISGIKGVSAGDVVASMETKPEGFLWYHKGELDSDKFAGDVGERIPAFYSSKGYLDAQVVKDTIMVDRKRGKAQIDLTVKEGVRYKIGTFEVTGSRRFSNEDLHRFYPFGEQPKSLTGSVKSVLRIGGNGEADAGYFDQTKWDDATRRVGETYMNEGYMYASVHPVVDRRKAGPDSVPTVNLRWEVNEGQPAIVNRVDILGNDVTNESCIRNQILVVPGDIFRRDALVRSYQSIGNLGFFETPIEVPETKQANDQGDLDIVFHVKEKRTGNVNFGASLGQGAGVGGFMGFDQPNLFGLCKKGSVNWQFGQFINDFSMTYSDPFIRESQISGTITAYHSQTRYYVSDVGRQTRVGGQLQVGFPLFGSRYSRIFASYGAEKVSYGNDGLVSQINCSVVTCARSTLGLSFEHDTRVGLPFPTDGGKQSLSAQVNGLIGGAQYVRYTGEMRHSASLIEFGGGQIGSEPIVLALSLGLKGGAVFGDPGGFYISQKFSLGGVQYGEPLRGYGEFCITPSGYNESCSGGSSATAQTTSYGSAFYSSTVELDLRVNGQLNIDMFYDAGNIWARPRDFNPTRLFRGIGFGASVVTPLGPLGLDYGWGLDQTENGVKKPFSKTGTLHFKLGQLF
ncbi:MAG: outer membrane protein assembly complex, YaeT protein [Gemmatimonadetes bacterium]|nr:outer membrane protein assembly complex, YaeT protein [Gemmatimonadota bacterium]